MGSDTGPRGCLEFIPVEREVKKTLGPGQRKKLSGLRSWGWGEGGGLMAFRGQGLSSTQSRGGWRGGASGLRRRTAGRFGHQKCVGATPARGQVRSARGPAVQRARWCGKPAACARLGTTKAGVLGRAGRAALRGRRAAGSARPALAASHREEEQRILGAQ